MKTTKLYRVGIALIEEGGEEITNWRNKNIIAKDAPEAIRKARLRKGEYVEGVVNLQTVDVL